MRISSASRSATERYSRGTWKARADGPGVRDRIIDLRLHVAVGRSSFFRPSPLTSTVRSGRSTALTSLRGKLSGAAALKAGCA